MVRGAFPAGWSRPIFGDNPLTILEIVFLGALALVAYTYVLFPLLVVARARLWPRPPRAADITPSVSVIVAAHDEAAHIADRLANLRALDYPADRLEVVVASDGSTDGTDAIARAAAWPGVRVLALPRVGKAAALEAAVAAAAGEVLVFTDANTAFAPDAVRALVRPLADPTVGGVAGDQRYRKAAALHAAGTGEAGYWSIDRWLKRLESDAGSTISATGAIYAIRRSLFQGSRPASPTTSPCRRRSSPRAGAWSSRRMPSRTSRSRPAAAWSSGARCAS